MKEITHTENYSLLGILAQKYISPEVEHFCQYRRL